MSATPHGVIVVMGVAGCGKSAVGQELARWQGLPFLDADTLHPTSNIDKMRNGQALTDQDRVPWLDRVVDHLHSHRDGIVVSCSALKYSYRDRLRQAGPLVRFVHLHGETSLLQGRLTDRTGHFMPASLLQSQLDTLEPLRADENGITLDVAAPLLAVIEAADTYLTRTDLMHMSKDRFTPYPNHETRKAAIEKD